MAKLKLFKVLVDDNFHYMDEGARFELGGFETRGEAVAACQEMVDSELTSMFKPGMSAEDLFDLYTSFGSDPFIVASTPTEGIEFSAWDFAKERCALMAKAAPPA